MQRKMTDTEPNSSYCMKGGDGPTSYSHNSRFQRIVVDATQEMIKHAITDKLDIKNLEFPNRFQVVDLGCSVGPNTFVAVQNIIESIENKYKTQYAESQIPEFQVFFNDNTSNDFNFLFKSLPPSHQYFAAGVPGSFYGRLFPKETIHFAHSSSALNWLSGVPQEVMDKNSPAWNKGSIYCRGTEKEVSEAYSGQYRRDIDKFLNARAEELVNGGLMIIHLGGLLHQVPISKTSAGKIYELLGSCFIEMAKKGLISEEKVESFNLPLYYPSTRDWETIIERNGCFKIEKMDATCPVSMKPFLQNVRMGVMHLRAALEGLIENHFGNEIVEQLFERYANKYAENIFLFDEEEVNFGLLSIVLKRKPSG